MNAVVKERKQRRCRVCSTKFRPGNSFQRVCGIECAVVDGRKHQAKMERRERRARKVALRTVSDWLKLAQARFNEYIRERDRYLPCVSCSTPAIRPVKWNAGHYRPAGNNSALRFDEANVHKQCESCNSFKSGNLQSYRESLLSRIGEKELARLEGPWEGKRWEVSELIEIRDKYRRMTSELRKSRG